MEDKIARVKELNEKVYGEYGIEYYLPMPEARNLSVPVTMGCSYNQCLYCDLNGRLKYKEHSVQSIKEKVNVLKEIHSEDKRPIKKAVISGGNPFNLPTEKLVIIADIIRNNFPDIEYISSFARADDILAKSDSELRVLKRAGYNHICMGLESGSDEVLSFHKKGVSAKENLKAMVWLENSGLSYSSYAILGLGGKTMQKNHIDQTLSMFANREITEIVFISLVLFKNAKLIEKVRNGEFKRLKPVEYLEEELAFVENLDLKTIFNGTHKNNPVPIKGLLPEHRSIMAEKLKHSIDMLREKNSTSHENKRWKSWSVE